MKIQRKKFNLYIYLLPVLALAMPLGLPNSLSQPLAILLCLPTVFLGGLTNRSIIITFLFSCLLAANSILQVLIHPEHESSFYQAVRSFVPFFLMLLIILSYNSRLELLQETLRSLGTKGQRFLNNAVTLFAFLCALQTVSYFLGVDLSNGLSRTGNGTRVMIFQTTSCALVAFYAMDRGKFFTLFCTIVVLLGTGSKSVFASLILVMAVAMFSKLTINRLVRSLLAVAVLVGALVYISPTAFLRLIEFAVGVGPNEALGDLTRAYEIAHAKETLTSTTATILLGAGFMIALTPGVPTNNAAFFENSKYDIENGFWGVMAKLGVLFTATFVSFLVRSLPFNRIIFCALLIELPMFLKTSYQIFAYMDGVYLLIWTLLLTTALGSEPSVKVELSRRRRKVVW